MSTLASAVGSSSHGTAVPASARASSWARAQRAVGHVDRERALLDQVLGGQLAHLAGADQQHRAAVEAVEDLLGQLHRGEGDRDRVPRDLRLRAHALGHAEGLAEQRVQLRPDRLARLRQREGVLHLAEDLRLADHHRVEAGGHAEGVADGVARPDACRGAARRRPSSTPRWRHRWRKASARASPGASATP